MKPNKVQDSKNNLSLYELQTSFLEASSFFKTKKWNNAKQKLENLLSKATELDETTLRVKTLVLIGLCQFNLGMISSVRYLLKDCKSMMLKIKSDKVRKEDLYETITFVGIAELLVNLSTNPDPDAISNSISVFTETLNNQPEVEKKLMSLLYLIDFILGTDPDAIELKKIILEFKSEPNKYESPVPVSEMITKAYSNLFTGTILKRRKNRTKR